MKKIIVLILIISALIIGCTIYLDYQFKQNHECYFGVFRWTTIFGTSYTKTDKFYVVDKIGCLWKIKLNNEILICDMNDAIVYNINTGKRITIHCEER